MVVCLLLICGLARPSVAADPLDWPRWRGPQQNGSSTQIGLPDSWNPRGGAGSNLLWKRSDLGSRSTPIVMKGRLYTLVRDQMETPREGEKVVCVDAASGATIWENRFNVYLSDVPDTRVGWSCVVGDPETDRVYALGVCGFFQCLEGATGKRLWSRSLHEEFGLLSTYGGRTNVPVIFEDLVILSAVVIGWGDMAKPAHRFLAFDKHTGQVVWFNGTRLLPYDTTYSTPTVTVLGGQQALVFGSGDGAVWAMQPRTGRRIWKYQFSRRGLNVSPLVVGDRVYSCHSEENPDDTTMGALVAIDALATGPKTKTGEMDITQTGEVWRVKERMVGKASPIMVDGQLVFVDDRATLFVVDPETGQQRVKKKLGTVMRSSPLSADGKIYLCTANGRWYILKLQDDRLQVVHQARLPSGEECHGSPIVSHGRLYLPTTGHLYCLADPAQTPAAGQPPAVPAERPVAEDTQPAQVQIVPAEVLLKPAQTQKFTVRLFNRAGQLLGETAAEFSLEGPGEIAADGTYTAPAGAQHGAAIVSAQVGKLTHTARVRVVPDFPWRFDFEDGQVPVTWVGARYRHQNRQLDGGRVMVKVTTIPKGTRSRAWMGHPDSSSYTIQADVRGAVRNHKLPDIGLIAQRYTLDLMGAYQQLQIRSWVPVMRMARTVDFPWKPDQWYVMKFRAEVQQVDGQPRGVLRGKVWPKGEPEPEAWTVTAVDEVPNLTGSPGLYGNAKDAELYYDNLTVTANED
ncbi:MAG: PQQ-binding-like beta-propeller repeat protein [Planctomycetales bacterium]|nr:PQQ-binding-like beta-propeller repeat protein [Planctomycetales bacterium]NIM07793.1 PQQ-binding-like beta-propeller repeat protein [Planctomycetales bacterium]NIN07284.1 PQQ-binding-like beta-propeller repeat protein [Planctomycetales bacterium]NIN76379.1 PQQ-binding-like beta-propeller repeat protein [Planctomycetales bacterium]NIO33584.1 PQQ-binding-like beta-propeller repeat protein [Planctomycetales bacterium]